MNFSVVLIFSSTHIYQLVLKTVDNTLPFFPSGADPALHTTFFNNNHLGCLTLVHCVTTCHIVRCLLETPERLLYLSSLCYMDSFASSIHVIFPSSSPFVKILSMKNGTFFWNASNYDYLEELYRRRVGRNRPPLFSSIKTMYI